MRSRVQLTPARATSSIVSRVDTHLSSTGFRHVHRRPRIKRPRKGSGPFQSVLKERSVDFNLTLDVQRLQQEIQQLTLARDLLQSRRLQRRESPTGSLMQIVRQFFQLFRQGFRVEQPSASQRRHVITAGAQSDFLYSVVDEEIDFGHGLRGVAFMVEMIRRYSLLLRFICLEMDSVEIVAMTDDHDDHEDCDDAGPSVLITATGSIRFQVLRETIVGLFPHIVGNETLCARLIGADVEAANVVRFYFDARSHIWRYEFDVDYVACFSRVLGDLRSVSELLGRSRIGDKSMFGVSKDGRLEAVELEEEDGDQQEDVILKDTWRTSLSSSSDDGTLFEVML